MFVLKIVVSDICFLSDLLQHHCISNNSWISDSLLTKLQTVQNAAAHVKTRIRKFDHITPVLHQLH